jgi:voltage-gated potassium channel
MIPDNNDSPKTPTIIFGGGEQGMAIAKWLGKQTGGILIVTSNPEKKIEIEKKGFNAIVIEHIEDENLQAIGIGQWVSTIFCMFQEDAHNVFVTLSARALAPNLRILGIADTNGSGQKLMAAGATKVIDPYEITGNRINELIQRPLLVKTLENTILGKANLDLSEIKIKNTSAIKGRRLSEINLDKYNLILLGVVNQSLSDRLMFNTAGLDHQLDADDYLVVIGPLEEIQHFREDNIL